jgi:hypothetical protein
MANHSLKMGITNDRTLSPQDDVAHFIPQGSSSVLHYHYSSQIECHNKVHLKFHLNKLDPKPKTHLKP